MPVREHTEETKKRIKQSVEKYYQTEAGQARLEKLKQSLPELGASHQFEPGNIPTNKGKKGLYSPSQKVRSLVSLRNSKPIRQLTKAGETVKDWPSIKSACIEMGIAASSISSCAAGRIKTCGGFVWRFLDYTPKEYNERVKHMVNLLDFYNHGLVEYFKKAVHLQEKVTMPIISPHHQYEIRYTAILDFPNTIRKVVAPFVKLAQRISVDNENSHNERITLSFDNEYYQIFITWDKLIFRFEGDKEDLEKNNSIVEEPFFNIFKKITEQYNFGEVKNSLYYSFNIIPTAGKKDNLNKFLEKYALDFNTIISEPTDVAITLEGKEGNMQNTLTFGPYMGVEDLTKRNIVVKNPLIVEQVKELGVCCEVKVLDITKAVNFSNYKEARRIERNYISKLWV